MEFGFLRDCLQSIEPDLPVLQQLMVDHGPAIGFQFHAGPGSGLECSNDSGSLTMTVRGHGVELIWRAGRGDPYPRFPALQAILTKIPDVWQLDVATIAYVNRIECGEGETLTDYVTLPITCDVGELRELNLSRAVIHNQSNFDFRIQANRRPPQHWFVSTSCGTLSTRGAFEDLENVRDACNVHFLELLTAHAKSVWKLS